MGAQRDRFSVAGAMDVWSWSPRECAVMRLLCAQEGVGVEEAEEHTGDF